MNPDELDAIEAAHHWTCLYCSLDVAKAEPCSLARVIAALREALIEQTRLINESSAWLAGADHARAQFSAERERLREEVADLEQALAGRDATVEFIRAERDAARADRDEWKDNAITLRGLLDNHAHNDEAMNQALRDMTVERDEARAELAEVTRRSRETLHINDELSAEVERLCDDMAHQVRRHGEAIARAEKAESERDEARHRVAELEGLLAMRGSE